MDQDSPPVVRPIPRRPFHADLANVTPPDDDGADQHVSVSGQPNGQRSSGLLTTSLDRSESIPPSLISPPSFKNLTSSTLMGIYSEAAANTRESLLDDNEELDTPWGTGARTPIQRPSIDEATYRLMRGRSHVPPQCSSFGPYAKADTAVTQSTSEAALSLLLRGALLFALGLGYGVLITRLHSEQNHTAPMRDDSIMKPGSNWKYLNSWGVAGVALGSLLPWFDTVWEGVFGSGTEKSARNKDAAPGTDWALVMRAIGAFVGIVFAIRKIPWVSTLQVSVALALVNPTLWWLIDRSKSGFVLSAAVGLAGSVLLVGLNPEIMPAPSGLPAQNASGWFGSDARTLDGFAHQQAVETGVWILSVLFCSCVCFGNIGRRLTWNRSSGRWGVIR
ncbi:uncharacterized protein UV8b_06584 [Ustilaginoidea virens]|uniref:Uncharacterized protein n=1 Tax=Ustilaginoidea virens TaxID=1159556 RepID=A0A063C484_USTVR|nr:uncharacterized protein UV8b_06584 [Ustilaginoidea virens]QUC22343.1 hypothetical protein UV8b_06584 [Ustilaginoidea virens]GAO14172.1 hypothetical protein UVI_02037460 [Ustilaginoidea virens]